MRYTLAQKRLITRSQESNRNNNKCRINQKYYSDFLQILFHKRIPPLCPIRFLLSLWYTWFCYRTINRFITNRSYKKKKAFIQGFICLMGRLMGFEPTSDGATIRCVNHFTTIAVCMMYYTWHYVVCKYFFYFFVYFFMFTENIANK